MHNRTDNNYREKRSRRRKIRKKKVNYYPVEEEPQFVLASQ